MVALFVTNGSSVSDKWLSWSIRIRTRYGGTGTRVPSSGPDSGTCVPAPAPENSKVDLNFIAAQLSSSSICVYYLI